MQEIALRKLSNTELDTKLRDTAKREREILAEVIEIIREVEHRRLYLDYGCTSLFSYLTERAGYAKGSAQRRIDAARLYDIIPEVKDDIASGALNLTHISILSHSVRQKEREAPKFQMEPQETRELLEKIKGLQAEQAQQIVAQELEVEIKQQEKIRVQADGSVRAEITFSKEDAAEIQRLREVISHINPNPTWAELLIHAVKYNLKREDPLRFEDRRKKRPSRPKQSDPMAELIAEPTTEAIAATVPMSVPEPPVTKLGKATVVPIRCANKGAELKETETKPQLQRQTLKYNSPRTKRFIHRRDQCCQWRDPVTGELCGSRFQLELDHIAPVWAGGTDDPSNLQLLCDAHNRLKYRNERTGAYQFF